MRQSPCGTSPATVCPFRQITREYFTPMIKLTRLDGQPFILNADLIRYVEQRPDTFVTLVSGERIVVNESMQQVVELAIDYQQRKAMLPSLMRRPSAANCQAGEAVYQTTQAMTFPSNVIAAE